MGQYLHINSPSIDRYLLYTDRILYIDLAAWLTGKCKLKEYPNLLQLWLHQPHQDGGHTRVSVSPLSLSLSLSFVCPNVSVSIYLRACNDSNVFKLGCIELSSEQCIQTAM